MPRNITVTFADGTTHVYRNAPDNVTPEQVTQRAQSEFGKQVKALDGGRRAAAKPAAPRSTARQFGDATVNALAGLAQGAAAIPDVVTDAVGGTLRLAGRPVTSGLSALAEAAGADGLAQGIRRTGAQWERAMARPATIGGMIERAAPTPKDTAGKTVRIASQLVGGALVPAGPKVTPPARLPKPTTPNPAREIVQEGNRAGIRVMTSDVRPPRTFLGKNTQAISEKIPFIGTGGPRAAQQEQRVDAVKTVLREFGGDDAVRLFDDAPGAIDDVAKSLQANRSAQIKKLTGVKTNIIQRFDGEVPVPQTVAAIDREIARLKSLNLPEMNDAVKLLEGWKTAVSGQNLNNIESIRKEMGKAFSAQNLANISDEGQKSVNAIYGPLRADMGNYIRSKGGPKAFAM